MCMSHAPHVVVSCGGACYFQLATAQEDRRRMKTIYERVMALNAAVSDPRVTGYAHPPERHFGLPVLAHPRLTPWIAHAGCVVVPAG